MCSISIDSGDHRCTKLKRLEQTLNSNNIKHFYPINPKPDLSIPWLDKNSTNNKSLNENFHLFDFSLRTTLKLRRRVVRDEARDLQPPSSKKERAPSRADRLREEREVRRGEQKAIAGEKDHLGLESVEGWREQVGRRPMTKRSRWAFDSWAGSV